MLASIGLEYHFFSNLAFTVLVLLALITTAVTGPMLSWLGVHGPGRVKSPKRGWH